MDGYRCLVGKVGQRSACTQGTAPNGAIGCPAWQRPLLRSGLISSSMAKLCLCDDRGRPNFRALHAEMRQRRPDTSRMAFFAFDLLFEHDVDLRPLSLSERQRNLARLCNKARKEVPCLFLVECFPEGAPLLEWSGNYGLEGIVSKRLSSRYSSGTYRDWRKTRPMAGVKQTSSGTSYLKARASQSRIRGCASSRRNARSLPGSWRVYRIPT